MTTNRNYIYCVSTDCDQQATCFGPSGQSSCYTNKNWKKRAKIKYQIFVSCEIQITFSLQLLTVHNDHQERV